MTEPAVRNPRAEADLLLPDGYEARVLEPSPPANTDPEWYADDPTDPKGADGLVVSPTSGGDITWDTRIDDHAELTGFVRHHWLGARESLADLPDGFVATRDALHQVAFFALAPARYAATGKMGLRWTAGGFGTPFFGRDEQLRIEGDLLVVQRGEHVTAEALTTVRAATSLLGLDYRERWFDDFHDPLPAADPDAMLTVDPVASRWLGDWFGFATAVLEELRRTDGADHVTRVQLWPEHFDPAVELGSAELNQRASYGASPGDADHTEPYLYVAPWSGIDTDDPYWNDDAFNGASLAYGQLRAAVDPFRVALEFLRDGHRILAKAD